MLSKMNVRQRSDLVSRLALCALLAGMTSWTAFPVGARADANGSAHPQSPQTFAPDAAGLIEAVDLAPETFVLANGLRVVVHTDRSAPLVGVAVWYDVGSAAEPTGHTGLAHLFEHLMFKGSENVPANYFGELTALGATDFDGVTTFDSTRYFETTPVSGLERALFLESDRMGHFLGAVNETALREQLGVVGNEKLEREGRPYGLMRDKIYVGLFGADHPYGHPTLGRMEDLRATDLATVRDWFQRHYGPDKAILILTGDITTVAARTLVERYFGAIPRGPARETATVAFSGLDASVRDAMTDTVPQTLLTRSWATPGAADPDAVALRLAASVLGELSTSPLERELVETTGLADRVQVRSEVNRLAGVFTVEIGLRPDAGLDATRDVAAAVLDRFIAEGPSEDELERAKSTEISQALRNLDALGGFRGRAVTLAEGMLLADDADFYRKQLQAIAAQTPASVQAAAARWLNRPSYELVVSPGPRIEASESPPPPDEQAPAITQAAPVPTRTPPALGTPPAARFPDVQRGRLQNGISLIYAHRSGSPMTRLTIAFDGGLAAEGDQAGIQRLSINAWLAATSALTSDEVGRQWEALGATTAATVQSDAASVTLDTPSAGLEPATSLLASLLRTPNFSSNDLERLRRQQVAAIRAEAANPTRVAQRVMATALAGGTSYRSFSDVGSLTAVEGLSRESLIEFGRQWYRPEGAKVFVVSDLPFDTVRAALDSALGDWRVGGAPGQLTQAPGERQPGRVILVDRPGAPQSTVVIGIPTLLDAHEDLLAVATADAALGESGTSRINLDIRETRNWSYGARGGFQTRRRDIPYVLRAAVQADRTGDVLLAIRGHVVDFTGVKPMTQAEFDFVVESAIRKLPGQYETAASILAGLQANDQASRPDDYVTTLADRYRALELPQVRRAIAGAIDPAQAVWVITGDAAVVGPQLRSLGMEYELAAVPE